MYNKRKDEFLIGILKLKKDFEKYYELYNKEKLANEKLRKIIKSHEASLRKKFKIHDLESYKRFQQKERKEKLQLKVNKINDFLAFPFLEKNQSIPKDGIIIRTFREYEKHIQSYNLSTLRKGGGAAVENLIYKINLFFDEDELKPIIKIERGGISVKFSNRIKALAVYKVLLEKYKPLTRFNR